MSPDAFEEDYSDREVSGTLAPGEGDVDGSLRPRSLHEFIGQPRVREQLQLVIEGAKNRGGTPDHILLSGPPGLGKTSLAMIIAAELGSSLRVTSGPALERAGDLAAMLSNLIEHDVLFIDALPPGRRDYPVRRADRSAARPLRLHRAHGLLRAPGAGAGAGAIGRNPGYRPGRGGGRGDRPALTRDAADRQPASPSGPRLRRGACGRRDHPRRRQVRACRLRRRRTWSGPP